MKVVRTTPVRPNATLVTTSAESRALWPIVETMGWVWKEADNPKKDIQDGSSEMVE
jgi:hypothetical protein